METQEVVATFLLETPLHVKWLCKYEAFFSLRVTKIIHASTV